MLPFAWIPWNYKVITNPNLFLHILSSLVNVRLHTENWLCNLAGSALKVPVVVVVESKNSDRLWLSFSLALAKPNNTPKFKKPFQSNRLRLLSLKIIFIFLSAGRML